MSYVKGDRVRMVNNPAQVGTVTGERDQMFLSFVGIQWDSGDFGFVAPSNIELDTPVAFTGLSEEERALLADAHQRALDAVTNIVGQSKPSPNGKELTDWQTRAERAEAELKAAKRVAKQHMNRADKAKAKVAAVEALTDHYAALIETMPKPHGVVIRTQAIFVRDVRTALDADQ